MKAVFDTNILIDYLNGQAQAKAEMALYDEKIISIISYMEVLVGANGEDEMRFLKRFLSNFHQIQLSQEIADTAVILRKTSRLKLPDAIIYATAKTEKCLLVTRNSKDFNPDLPDIRQPYTI